MDGVGAPAVLRDLVRTTSTRRGGDAGRAPAESFSERLARAGTEERPRLLLELVRSHAATVLGHSSGQQVSPQAAFKELGFDSLTAVELRNRLKHATGLRLPATLLFDLPTPAEVARHLHSRMTSETADASAPGSGSLLARLDELAEALRSVAGTDDGDGVTERLQELVRLWDTAHDGRRASAPDGELAEATDDELFHALDSELGTV
jgi:polyene macrolide polyketide synthase